MSKVRFLEKWVRSDTTAADESFLNFEQKLEMQKKATDEQKKQLLPLLNDKITKVESIRSALNGNRVHANLEELNQKLFIQQHAVIKLQEGNFSIPNKRFVFIFLMCRCCGVTQEANPFKGLMEHLK